MIGPKSRIDLTPVADCNPTLQFFQILFGPNLSGSVSHWYPVRLSDAPACRCQTRVAP
jgi:hypothetical protein